MRNVGAKRYRIGYTFPNVDIFKIEINLKINKKLSEINKLNATEEPKLTLKPMMPNGTITFIFNQDMLHPTKEIDQEVYGNIFKIRIKSLKDLSVYVGEFKNRQPKEKIG